MSELDFDNPFRMPKPEEIFEYRDKEQKRKAEERLNNSKLPIWKKDTHNSRVSRNSVPVIPKSDTKLSEVETKKEEEKRLRVLADEVVATVAKGVENEDLRTFIDRKREMFFLQLSLNIKKQEIDRLDKEIKDRRLRLKQERGIFEDSRQIYENNVAQADENAVKSITEAEDLFRKRSENVVQYKKLSTKLTRRMAEKTKLEEQLEDNLSIKKFLDNLVPKDWLRQQHLKIRQKYKISEDKPIPEEYLDEIPLYFTEPQQLLVLFRDLEERNLFLIQNVQEKEAELEALRQTYKLTEERLESKKQTLDSQVNSLTEQIDQENRKRKELKNRLESTEKTDVQVKSSLAINEKIQKLHRDVVDGHSTSTDPLQLLSEIESMLDMLLKDLDKIPDEYLKMAQKMKEHQRREHQRKESQEKSRIEREVRNQRVLERAQEPPRQFTRVMYRSYLKPQDKKSDNSQKVAVDDNSKEDPYADFFV
eukprot:TRINITY_DN2708_c0_g1_i1.p1 TRINITY_DN2708_c0_g1~~TRINITY_DN2708_c0_g1_i1.p1  ORF type:complete len:478 (-),score=148.24 TRINITY_DN2708_c0_g1_i1:37-1470(-)